MSGVITVQPISEASRLQRKGRVGRTSSGTVYYMYEKNAREKIKPKYNITNDDFHLSFLKLLNKSTKETQYIEETFDDDDNIISSKSTNIERQIITNSFSPYNYEKFVNFKEIIKDNRIKEEYFYKKNLHNIYLKQYLNENEIDIKQYFTDIYNDDDDIPIELIKFETGYKDVQLFDLNGSLYIIHPYETKINRNINNEIIIFNGKKNNIINERIFDNMLKKHGNKNRIFKFKL